MYFNHITVLKYHVSALQTQIFHGIFLRWMGTMLLQVEHQMLKYYLFNFQPMLIYQISKNEFIYLLLLVLKSLAVQWMFLKSSMDFLPIKQVNMLHGVGKMYQAPFLNAPRRSLYLLSFLYSFIIFFKPIFCYPKC